MSCFNVRTYRADSVDVSINRVDDYKIVVSREGAFSASLSRVDVYRANVSITCEVVGADISLPGSYIYDDDTVLLFDDGSQILC